MAKNKKSNGEGSISFEADRKMYRARFTDPQGKRLSQRFKTKKEAKEWLAVLQADISKNTYVQPNSISLGSWMLDFLQTYKAPKVRPKTLERYMHCTLSTLTSITKNIIPSSCSQSPAAHA